MKQLFFDQGIIDDEFKKRRARIIHQSTYNNRVTGPGYFAFRLTASQAVVKIIHHRGNVADLARYITKEEKTKNGESVYSPAGIKLSNERLKSTIGMWRARDRQFSRGNARHSTHIVLSTKENPTRKNISKLKEAVAEVAFNHFTVNGFDALFSIHDDRNHLHAHLMVHNTNLVTNKKIRFSKQSDIFSLRKDFAQALNKQGWNYTACLRKDFMSERDKASEKMAGQNYILHQIEQSLGVDARNWAKKRFILKYSDDTRKAAAAKENLNRIRNFDNLSSDQQKALLSEVAAYKKQKEKWGLKQITKARFPEFDEKLVYAYVDSLFASRQIVDRQANTKTPSSIHALEVIDASISDLSANTPDKISRVQDRILAFKRTKVKQERRAMTIRELNQYGEIGKIYLRTLYKNLDYASSDKQKEIVNAKIASLIAGEVSEDEINHFKLTTLKKNTTPYLSTFNQRIDYISKVIADRSGAPRSGIDQVEKIFTVYGIQRGIDSVYAYRRFEKTVDRYVDVLSLGNAKRIDVFARQLDRLLTGDSRVGTRRFTANKDLKQSGSFSI